MPKYRLWRESVTTKQHLELILDQLKKITGQNDSSDKLLEWLKGYISGLINDLD